MPKRSGRLKNLSQEDLALAADLSRVYVSEVERDLELKELVDPDMFQAMRKTIGKPPAVLTSATYFRDQAAAHGRRKLEA